jgi:hypothetical protein
MEKVPALYRTGIGFDASDKFFIGLEIEKCEAEPVSLLSSFEYKPIPGLLLRAGWRTDNSSTWFAAGINIRKFRIEILGNYHPQLGLSSGLLFIFLFP